LKGRSDGEVLVQSDLQVMPAPKKYLGGPCFAQFFAQLEALLLKKIGICSGSGILAADFL
jgi:hypothetical protein